jgi:outer membrane protein OmpA-like peptidoglycan-associated protein
MFLRNTFHIRHWTATYAVTSPVGPGEGAQGGDLEQALFILKQAFASGDATVVAAIEGWYAGATNLLPTAAAKQAGFFGRTSPGAQGQAAPFESTRMNAWRHFEQNVRGGALALTPVKHQLVFVNPVAPPIVHGPEAPREPEPTWFEIKVIDEVGNPISGLSMTFTSGTQQSCTTDGSGKARVDSDSGSFGSFSFVSEDAVRQELKTRWSKPQGKAWYKPAEGSEGQHSIVQVRRNSKLGSVSVTSKEPHTLVLQPRIVQAKLKGLWFDSSKSFLLPTARHSLQQIESLYRANPESDLLIVGHTDLAGGAAYNDELSLDRAKAMAAYLTDDVATWYAWYGSDKPSDKRWGAIEDELMIEAVADDNGEKIPSNADAVRWYQETRGLTVDGDAGPQTRQALIAEYMALDDTTLPKDIRLTTHGCGENFPAKQTADGAAEQENRRVEVFFFDNPIPPPDRPDGILPPPPGNNSPAGGREYSEWVLRTQEVHEFEVGRWIRLLLRYDDGTAARNVNATVLHSGSVQSTGTTDARGVLMIHGVVGDEWSLLDIQDASEVVTFQ